MRIWDLPTRVFHWSLAAGFCAAYVSARLGPAWTEWHQRAGYLVTGLLLFRLAWGLVGGSASRFSQLLKPPSAVVAYLRSLRAGVHESGPGHNPAGGWMVALMLASLSALVASGMFADDLVAFSGPLASCVSSQTNDRSGRLHELFSQWMLVLVALHLCAIAFYSRVLGDRQLLRSMLTVRRHAADPAERGPSPWLAFIVILVAAAVVEWIASGAICGDPL